MNLKLTSSIILSLAISTNAYSAPEGGIINSGTGTILKKGAVTNIKQNSQRLDINWRKFDTKRNESVNFYQPNSSAIAINRVTGGVPSYLQGSLKANGRVIIMNDSGITFAKGSQTNIGSLMATTAKNISFDNFVPNIIGFNGAYGSIVNDGNINSNKGTVMLIAEKVKNNGVIKADNGSVHLLGVSNGKVAFEEYSKHSSLWENPTNNEEANYEVTNNGLIQTRSGIASLKTQASRNSAASSVINLNGVVDATSFKPNGNGGVILASSGGDVNVNGLLNASANVRGNGGTVNLQSGVRTILIDPESPTFPGGDDLFGKGSIVITKNAEIKANSGSKSGNAGTVGASAFTSDSGVRLDGKVEAKGADDGKGGQVYLSGGILAIQGEVPQEIPGVVISKDASINITGGNKNILGEVDGVPIRDYGFVYLFGGKVDVAGKINANGTENGNASYIELYGLGNVDIRNTAKITAQGGTKSGDGGGIGVASKNIDIESGSSLLVNAQNPTGKNGSITINEMTDNLLDGNLHVQNEEGLPSAINF